MDNQNYIDGLLRNDDKVLKMIYHNYAGRIKNHVVRNGGSADDAKDIFQDALMIIYKKAQNDDFELTSQFYSYLFGICRNLFDRKRKKNARNSMTKVDLDGYIYDSDLEQDLFDREKHKIYTEKFQKLDKFCKKILELYFTKVRMEEIAITLNLKNAHTARNRKYRCQKELEKMIRADVRYKELHKN